MNYFFSADEHYGHYNVIRYNNRPFVTIKDMTECLIEKHNKKVSNSSNNVTIHVGDFSWAKRYQDAKKIIARLNGKHIFLRGSHDVWMRDSGKFYHERWEKKINGKFIIADHYSHRVWPKSHYGSWMLFGHSHGSLKPFGKSMDVGVDTNNYEPYSFDEIESIMSILPDNFNLIKE